MPDTTRQTLRMTRCGADRTLDGYVFTDHEHARQWLSQPFVNRGEISLDEVEVGPMTRCTTCGGTGHRQKTRSIRKLTPEEVRDV